MWAVTAVLAILEDFFLPSTQATDISTLPVELLHTLSLYFPVSDAKNMALTCKLMYSVFKERVWRHPTLGPTFNSFYLSPSAGYHRWPNMNIRPVSLQNLARLSHLPIRELNACWLNFEWWAKWDEVMQCCPNLRTFYIDDGSHNVSLHHLKEVFVASSVEVVLHTNSLTDVDCMNVDALLEVLSFVRVKGVIVNHVGTHEEGHDRYDPSFVWTVQQLANVASRHEIIKVSLRSIEVSDKNVKQFIDLLSSVNCSLAMEHYTNSCEPGYVENRGYLLSVNDLEYLVHCGVRVPILSIGVLRATCTEEFVKFIGVIQELKGLEEFCFFEWHCADVLPLDVFTLLPVKYMNTDMFSFNEDTIDEVATLERMHDLEYLVVGQIHNFTFNDVSLLRNLPVRTVSIQFLNYDDFSTHLMEYKKLMAEMGVIEILLFQGLGEPPQGVEVLGIDIINQPIYR